MSIILNGFTNEYGENFDNIRDVHFNRASDILTECGRPIYESDGVWSQDPVAIFRSMDPQKALRLDKNYLNYLHVYRHDDVLVSQLQSRQKDVSLTNFPTGIVTIEDKVIGQEIPFYENTITLAEAAKTRRIATWSGSLEKSIEILKIIRELLQAGVIYFDIHSHNFVYNQRTEKLNLIDFDSRYIRFDDHRQAYKHMTYNLKMTINDLASYYGHCFDEEFFGLNTIEEIEEYIQDTHHKVLKIETNYQR